jgi:peroxiredoxin
MKTITKSLLSVLALGTAGATLGATPALAIEPGAPAPDFTLQDTEGKSVHLSDYKGKYVVLEWFNPGCPFVKAAHTKGSLVGFAKREEKKGVVWLAINSSAAGKQGSGAEATRASKKTFELDHPILLDESGKVGHAYGATNTPHLFVIGKDQKVLYAGAIDNSPDGEGQSPQSGKLLNYVDQALTQAMTGHTVDVSSTKPYGCGVKY